jgi:hypothetical protein
MDCTLRNDNIILHIQNTLYGEGFEWRILQISPGSHAHPRDNLYYVNKIMDWIDTRKIYTACRDSMYPTPTFSVSGERI